MNTDAIISYLKAKKAAEDAAKALAAAKAALLALMDGQVKGSWRAEDGHEYSVCATYGKTRRDLNADLIREVLGVEVTESCYRISKPWDEVRVAVVL